MLIEKIIQRQYLDSEIQKVEYLFGEFHEKIMQKI